MTDNPIVLDVQVGCARCGADEHHHMEYQVLENPVEWDGEIIATHWCPCPSNGQPILMNVSPKEEE